MSDIPDVMYWRGRNVEELTRDELLEVIRHIAYELAHYRRPGVARAIGLGAAEMLRRGERTFV